MWKRKALISSAVVILLFFASGFLFPGNSVIPVKGAGKADWNHKTFWHEPWGVSGVHKGIDIFARLGQTVVSSTPGVVIATGTQTLGGNYALVLGPKWRLHYYAHLDKVSANKWGLVSAGDPLGEVGDTGNAKGRPAHLHYAVMTLIPYPWRWDDAKQGWKKIFFLNPSELLLQRSR